VNISWKRQKQPGSKYKNNRVSKENSHDGRSYASTGEERRSAMLKLDPTVSEIEYQVRLALVVNGSKVTTYVPDFRYSREGTEKKVIEDFKGMETPEFKLKWKLAQALYPDYEFVISNRKTLNGGGNGNRGRRVTSKTGPTTDVDRSD
jgi:hypothetical protein